MSVRRPCSRSSVRKTSAFKVVDVKKFNKGPHLSGASASVTNKSKNKKMQMVIAPKTPEIFTVDKKKKNATFTNLNVTHSLKKEQEMDVKTVAVVEAIRNNTDNDRKSIEWKRNSLVKSKESTRNILKVTSVNANWTERSKVVKDKLEEIMKKHTATLKTLTNIYHTPAGANNKNIATKYKSVIKTVKNSSITLLPDNPLNNLKIQTVAPVTKMTTSSNSVSLAKRSISVSRYNQSAASKSKPAHRESSDLSKKSTNSFMPVKDEVKILREKADLAIRGRKTYTICGNFYTIRQALQQRGWIEKLSPNYCPPNIDAAFFKRLQTQTIPELSLGLKDKDLGQVYRRVILSKMVGNVPVSFHWDLNRETYRNNAENLKDCYINFINKNRFSYANKQGLCECAKSAYWWNDPGVSHLRTPRSYSLVNNGDPDEFITDFKTTAAMSLLKWIVYTHENNVSRLISDAGKVPLSYFHFALRECANFVRKLKHEDIDHEIPTAPDREWQIFLDHFYKAVHVGNHFKQSGLETELSLVHKSKTMLNKLRSICSYLDMDGYMNIWILKPSFGSRGMGIHFCRTLQFVLKVIRENKNCIYVIQKYIERPLLIYNTKFDIRQWFLISSTQPLTIWIYKECYLRFSSQTYNLRKLHESIHLTNNSVQSKYHNGNRDICLPFHNMWFLKEFKAHLENIGYPDVFDRIIFPGMKECILAAILTNQDSIFKTPRAFELHGADFMITEDFQPWLIEINSKPALNPSTLVTAKLCPMVLEDVIKVVVDNSRNPQASTGHFELIYRESILPVPKMDLSKLRLEGRPLGDNYFLPPEDLKRLQSKTSQRANSTDSLNVITTADYMKYVGEEMKRTLQHLLSVIEKERERRRYINESTRNKQLIPIVKKSPTNANGDDNETKQITETSEDEERLKYYQNMQKIQSNMQEIEEIFRQDIFSKVPSEDNLCTVPPPPIDVTNASDNQLRCNSRVITKALSALDKRPASRIVDNVMKIVSGLTFIGNDETRNR